MSDDEIERLIAASSLGTPEVQALIARTPPGVGRAIALAARYLGRAEDAEAERDRLREDLARERWVRLAGDTERDRLRAVVDALRRASHLYWIAESADFDDITPVTVAMTKVELMLGQLDVSPNTGGDT